MPMENIPYRVPDKKKASPAPVQPSNPYGTMEKIPFRVPDKKKASPVPASPAPANASGVTDLSKLTTSSSPIALMDYRKGLAEGNTSATTRSVGTNELSATQLNNLLSGNSKYIQNARLSGAEDAASRGLGTSSYSAGLSERAAIASGLPIAQQDAATYGRTASENMAAQNADALADQSNAAALFGQTMGLRANLDDSERGRGFTSAERVAGQEFTSGENALQRGFLTGERLGGQEFTAGQNELQRGFLTGERLGGQQFTSGENALQRGFQTGERLGGQEFTAGQNEAQRGFLTGERLSGQDFTAGQNELQRGFLTGERLSGQEFSGGQQELNRQADRIGSYFNLTSAREQALAQTLNGIYSNPNLTPAQQQAAAQNAQRSLTSQWNNANRALAAGIPDVFLTPGPIQSGGQGIPGVGGGQAGPQIPQYDVPNQAPIIDEKGKKKKGK